MTRRASGRAASLGLALLLAGCGIAAPEDQDFRVSGEAPAAAADVFAKADAWTQRGGWTVLERVSPTRLRLQRPLAGQNRSGRLDFTTAAGATAGSTKYEVHTWTEVLGIKSRENDAEVIADAQSLGAALQCPQAKWPSCP